MNILLQILLWLWLSLFVLAVAYKMSGLWDQLKGDKTFKKIILTKLFILVMITAGLLIQAFVIEGHTFCS